MGKVKDGAPASKASKPSKGGPRAGTRGAASPRSSRTSSGPTCTSRCRGWHARLYTAIGLGVIVVLGPLAAATRPSDAYAPADPVRRPGRRRAGPRLAHLPDRPVPAVRRLPDRHRSRDEQGLVDQPRRPVPGDHGRPGDGLPDGRLPLRRRLALVEPAPAHRRPEVRRRRRLRLAGRLSRAGRRPARRSPRGPGSPDSPVPSTLRPGRWPPFHRVAPHESSDRRDPRTGHQPGLDGQPEADAGAADGLARTPAGRSRSRSRPPTAARPTPSPARAPGPTPSPPAGRRGRRRRPRPEPTPAATTAAGRPPPPDDDDEPPPRAGLVRPEGPEQPRGHDPRRPGAPGQDPGPAALLRPDRRADREDHRDPQQQEADRRAEELSRLHHGRDGAEREDLVHRPRDARRRRLRRGPRHADAR